MSNQLDTTVDIWEYFYRVRMPYMQTRTLEDIRQKGTVISGVASYDADIGNQLITMCLNIDQMAEYFREGVPIRVCDPKDTKQIYEAISRHIHAWKGQLERGINIGDAPIEDLILLDRLAHTVYEHAKYHFTNEGANSVFAQHLGRISMLNNSNFFSSKVQQDDGILRINGDNGGYEERDSLQDFFKSRSGSLRSF